MKSYTITDQQKIDGKVEFIRIKVDDVAAILKEVVQSLSDIAWISSFDAAYVKAGFQDRADATIKHISEKIIKQEDSAITSSSGEYVVSELARRAVVDKLKYLDVPLAELLKDKVIGNPGFDFYSKSTELLILFGEAKYNSSQNSYGQSFEQIIRFIKEGQDGSDLLEIDRFYCNESRKNFENGKKGYIAAFTARKTKTEQLIKNIQKNEDFKELVKFDEIICIGIEL